MRTLLIAALALSSTLPSPDADACGGYTSSPEPQVMQLTHHRALIGDDGKVLAPRSFVRTRELAPDGLAWSWLTPRSFDTTMIAPAPTAPTAPAAPTAATPVTFTLLGPAGTRVVTATRKVFLADARPERGAHGAFEVPVSGGARFELAMRGDQADARWIGLEEVAVTGRTLRWLAALGVTPDPREDVQVRRLRGTPFEVVSVYPKGGSKMVTLLKQGGRNHGSWEGLPVAGFSNRGARQLVIADAGRVTLVYLDADA